MKSESFGLEHHKSVGRAILLLSEIVQTAESEFKYEAKIEVIFIY